MKEKSVRGRVIIFNGKGNSQLGGVGGGGHCKWKSVIYPYFLHILKFHFDPY